MISLKSVIGGAGPIGSERWFHKNAASPLLTLDGATYLRSGNISTDTATYPDAFAKFKISPATAWANITSFTTAILYFCEFVNGAWWAGGAGGVLFTSQDGLTWTAVAHVMGTNALSDISYGNGTYVITSAVSSTQPLMTSTDGVNWVKCVAFASAAILWSTVYVGGYFIVVGNAARSLRSTNGVNWLEISSGMSTSYNFTCVATDGVGYRCGSTSVATLYGHSDVSSWAATGTVTADVGVAVSIGYAINDIEYGNGMWVIAHPSGYYSYSADGMLWPAARAKQITANSNNAFNAVGYGGGFFLLGSASGNFFQVKFSSLNTPVESAAIAAALVAKMFAYGDGQWVVVPTTAVVSKVSPASAIGIPVETYPAPNATEVVKYMRIK